MALLELSFASGETSLSVRRFSVHEAISSLFTVSVWARKGNIPQTPPTAGIPSAPGSAVTLRFLGEIVGRGTDASGGPTTLWRSASLALADAQKKLPVGAGSDALEERRTGARGRDVDDARGP